MGLAVTLPLLAFTGIAAYVHVQGNAVRHLQTAADTTTVLAELASGGLTPTETGWALDDQTGLRLQRAASLPRVHFLEIAGPDRVVIYRSGGHAITQNFLSGLPRSWVGERVFTTAQGHLAVHRTPLPPANGVRVDSNSDWGRLTLTLSDRDVPELMTPTLWLIGAAGVGLACIAGPVAAMRVRDALHTLPALNAAIGELAEGRRPVPLATGSTGELGDVAFALNAMVETVYDARAELGAAHEKLERQVEMRTVEVRRMNEKLEAEAADKNEFLRAITHDLNAPLRNIIGMVQMLKRKHQAHLPDDGLQKLDRIEANAKHQTELISDLLELSRLRARAPSPEPIDLQALVGGIVEQLSHDLETAEIQLTVAGGLPAVLAERTRIRQVFQNLIDNAIKYMMDAKERRITVSCTLTRDFQPDIFKGVEVIEFSVADTGRGIAAQDIDQVFQVFNRSTHSGTHSVAGRGVGLASVRTIVEQMGGRIWVESSLNVGSTFFFTLPVSTLVPEGVPASDGSTVAAIGVSASGVAMSAPPQSEPDLADTDHHTSQDANGDTVFDHDTESELDVHADPGSAVAA